MAFHWRDGIHFMRHTDGNVEIFKEDVVKGERSQATRTITYAVIPPAEWALIIASVSSRGETTETYREAERFHTAPDIGKGGVQAAGQVTRLIELLQRIKDACTYENEEAAAEGEYGLPLREFQDIYTILSEGADFGELPSEYTYEPCLARCPETGGLPIFCDKPRLHGGYHEARRRETTPNTRWVPMPEPPSHGTGTQEAGKP